MLPAAVMAACDRVALDMLETCREARIDVPGKMAVLGKDVQLVFPFSVPPATDARPLSRLGELMLEIQFKGMPAQDGIVAPDDLAQLLVSVQLQYVAVAMHEPEPENEKVVVQLVSGRLCGDLGENWIAKSFQPVCVQSQP